MLNILNFSIQLLRVDGVLQTPGVVVGIFPIERVGLDVFGQRVGIGGKDDVIDFFRSKAGLEGN